MPNTSSRPFNKSAAVSRARNFVCAFYLAVRAIAGVESTAAAETKAPTASPRVVVIEGMKFSPSVLHIKPGESIVFKNSDLVPHTATSKGKKHFDSGPIQPGESWTLEPAPSEPIHYACSFHPTMEGDIVVDKP